MNHLSDLDCLANRYFVLRHGHSLANEEGIIVSHPDHGVGGYGPALSFLNFREKVGLYPDARVAVLGIMYENVYRMMNSYWPVLYDTFDYGLKAHMSGGAITGFPGPEAFADLAAFRARAASCAP